MNSSYLKYVAKIEENMKKAQARLAEFEQGPCQDGYVQIGVKEKDGRTVPNCVPEDNVGE